MSNTTSNKLYNIMSVSAIILAFFALAGVVWSNAQAHDESQTVIPTTLNYQGYLREPDGSLTNGAYKITANIYNGATGGEPLYTTVLENVIVRDGLFNIVLGDNPAMTPAVFANSPLYIGITLNDHSELIPRQRLHAVPWAFQSSTLVSNATLQGFTSNGPIIVNGTTTINGAEIITGSETISGTETVLGNAIVQGNSLVNGYLDVQGKIRIWNPNKTAYTPSINFIFPKVTLVNKGIAGQCGTNDWTTIDVSSYVPTNAQAVILEGHGAINGPDGGDPWQQSAHIIIRPTTTTESDNFTYVLVRGAQNSSGDGATFVGQGIFPLDPTGTSFQYKIWVQPFNYGCFVFLVGYIL